MYLTSPEHPYNHEEWVKKNSYIIKLDDTMITPENYEQVLGEPMPERWQKWYEENHPEETGAVPQAFPDEDIDAMRAAAREAAEAERVKFEQGLRELERLMSMSDAEIAAELERRFTPQPPELPTDENLENRLWSEIQPNRLTPARFEAAFRILEQYGPEEGMHRLHTADPKLAAQVGQLFGPPPAERPPEKPNTAESPQPPEAPPERR